MRDLHVQPDTLRAAAPRWSAAAREVSTLDRLLAGLGSVACGDASVDGACDRLAGGFRTAVLAYAAALEADRDRLLLTAGNYAVCDAEVRAELLRRLPPLLRLEHR